jgi:hypothetical protein
MPFLLFIDYGEKENKLKENCIQFYKNKEKLDR